MMASVPPTHLETHSAPPSSNRVAPVPGLCQAGHQRQSRGGYRVSAFEGSLESILPNFLPLKMGKLPWLVWLSG